jgi:hypothetical protein
VTGDAACDSLAAFHDITRGNNAAEFPSQTVSGYTTARGWDPVTGLGSPDVRVLIPLLARNTCRESPATSLDALRRLRWTDA